MYALYTAGRTRTVVTGLQHLPVPWLSRSGIRRAGTVAWSKQTARPVKENKELPKNEAIPFELVHYITEDTPQGLPPLVPLAQILARINQKTDYIKLVSSKPPIVRVFNYKEEQNVKDERDRLAKQAARASTRKEVQMTWTAAPADIQHKLNKALKELSKGRRVDLALSRSSGGKSRAPVPTNTEVASYIENVMEILGDKVVQWKEMESRAHGVVVLYLEPAKPTKGNTQGDDKS